MIKSLLQNGNHLWTIEKNTEVEVCTVVLGIIESVLPTRYAENINHKYMQSNAGLW